jgi:hypothetical protein
MVLAPRTLFEKKDKVMRAPKKVLHVLQFLWNRFTVKFVE